MKKTILNIELVGYNAIAEARAATSAVDITAKLNQQIQSFVDLGLQVAGLRREMAIVKTTGDGVILAFDDPSKAHSFSSVVQQASQRNNATKPNAINKRLFRIGIATGEVETEPKPARGAHPSIDTSGPTVTSAVRLSRDANAGEVLCDAATFEALKPEQQKSYPTGELIDDDTGEKVEIYRSVLNADGIKDALIFVAKKSEIRPEAPQPVPATSPRFAGEGNGVTAGAGPMSHPRELPADARDIPVPHLNGDNSIRPLASAATTPQVADLKPPESKLPGLKVPEPPVYEPTAPPAERAPSPAPVKSSVPAPLPTGLAATAVMAVDITQAMVGFNARRALVPEPEPANAREAFLRRLSEEPWNLGFYQAVRRLENFDPQKPRIGHARRVADDPIRFCQSPSLAFAPATMSGFKQATDTAPPRLFVEFLGLCGPSGPMPLHVTEYLRDRERNNADPTPARFFDVFHHRMISMFYRAWAINQQTVSFERSLGDAHLPGGGLGDRFAMYVASIVGVGMTALRNRDAFPDRAKLFYAGRLSNQGKNPEGLAAVVGDYLGVEADITEFVGRWIDVPVEARCKLGHSPETGGLGTTALVGSRVWDCQQEFQIQLGPMDFKTYQRLLPGGPTLRRLASLVRNYIGDEFSWTIRLILRADAVPRARLGQVGQLGYSTWMGSKPFTKDQDNLELRPSAA